MGLLDAAIAVFIVGNLYRALRILRLPLHLRWELYPLPHDLREKQLYGGSYFEETEWWTKLPETTLLGEWRFILKEVFFMNGVWEQNRTLWLWSWLLHFGLYMLVAAVTLGAAALFAARFTVEASGAVMTVLRIVSWMAVCAGFAGALGLIVLRVVSLRLRPYTTRGGFLNLAVLAALFSTGLAGMIFEPAMVENMLGLLGALLGLRPTPTLSAITLAHVSVVGVFLAYFPFTHMTHAYMKFFAFHSVRWDDKPAAGDFVAQRSLVENLGRSVSWAAPHIGSDGTKSWRQVVSTERSGSEPKS